MSRVSSTAPAPVITLQGVKDSVLKEQLQTVVRQLIRILGEIRRDISLVDHLYVSQNSQPTPEEGELLVWKDADATAGNPQAYIVTKQDGVVYTFASNQLVP